MIELKPYSSSAKYYDMIYLEKSAQAYDEMIRDFLEVSDEVLGRRPKNLIDLGCGTGTHAIRLANKGVEITGIDLSQDQIDLAIEKSEKENMEITFIQGDMANLPSFDKKFESAAAFFSSFCYLLKNQDVLNFLNKVYELTTEKSFLFFEFWNTLGIRNIAWDKFEVEQEGVRLIRFNQSLFDFENSQITMPMEHIIMEDDKILEKFTETHILRTYTLSEFKTLVNLTKWKVHSIFNGIMGSTRQEPIKRDSFRYIAVLTK